MLHTLVLGSLLGGNNIGDKGAVAIGEALKVNVALQELYLSDGIIGDAGAMALAEGLKVNVVRYIGQRIVSILPALSTPANRPVPASLHPSLVTDRC